ncbi:MAG: DUF502 domain-containing protein [Flavobacteriales bacterium]|nr:DUF502 domain-containing protein [Flavobacteriales bacterium]
MNRLLKYFLQGLLYIIPVAITIYITVSLLKLIDGIIPFEIPGLGIAVLLALITFLGFIGSTILAQPIISYFDGLIKKAPLIKIIYTSIKDLLSAFVGNKKRFDKPVLVKIGRDSGLEKIGFITQKDLSNLGISEGKSAVYLPHSYNFSGNLFVVANENITELDMNAADAMKFIVSGGVTAVKEEN